MATAVCIVRAKKVTTKIIICVIVFHQYSNEGKAFYVLINISRYLRP